MYFSKKEHVLEQQILTYLWYPFVRTLYFANRRCLFVTVAKLHEQHKQARAAARVFKSPVFTIWYFVSKVVPEKVVWGISALNANKAYLALVLLAIGGFAAGLIVDGPQQDVRILLPRMTCYANSASLTRPSSPSRRHSSCSRFVLGGFFLVSSHPSDLVRVHLRSLHNRHSHLLFVFQALVCIPLFSIWAHLSPLQLLLRQSAIQFHLSAMVL
jgi:hypothetical protein